MWFVAMVVLIRILRRKLWNCWTLLVVIFGSITILWFWNYWYYLGKDYFRKGQFENNNAKKTLTHVAQVIRPSTWTDLTESFDVCLATQTTVDRLATIGQVAENWQGPISLAIFLHEEYEFGIAADFLQYMMNCHYWFNGTVSVTIVVSNVLLHFLEGNEFNLLEFSTGNFNGCNDSKSLDLVLTEFYSPLNISNTSNYRYPQNHLRNIARSHCETDWIFLTDVDLIPKYNSASTLQTFYESDEAKFCSKCAFVIPTFSLSGNCSQQPSTKLELLSLVTEKRAEPFHFTSWAPAQEPTNYHKWSITYKEEEPVHVSHQVNYSIDSTSIFQNVLSFYEPFYISSNSIPFYDTRFIGYGFTRNSQTFESIVSGWSFYVLTPIFITHCGIQPKHEWTKHPNHPRHDQIRWNKPIYQLFSKTIWMKYRKHYLITTVKLR